MSKKKRTRTSRQASSGNGCQMSFFPEPVFNPTYPKPNTHASKCLSLLLDGGKINHPQFDEKVGSWRLAAYVNDLIKLGWPICSDDVKFQAKDGAIKFISNYYLHSEVIEAAKGGDANE
jgi:hypothetical protein